MKLAPVSDAAVLCAITVTGVAISEEERVKTSACPLFHSYTHAQTHTFFPPPSLWLSVIYTLLSSWLLNQIYSTEFKHTWTGLRECRWCVLQRNTPQPSRESRLVLASLAEQPKVLCGCGLTWFVLGCWSSMASVLSVAPVSLELCSSPPPLASIHPLHRCAGCTEPLQSQQSFARDSHPTGGTITRGFQNRWEELNPNKITIHISFFFCSIEQGLSV